MADQQDGALVLTEGALQLVLCVHVQVVGAMWERYMDYFVWMPPHVLFKRYRRFDRLVGICPKRGFNNSRFGKCYAVVNVSSLNKFNDGDVVDVAALLAAGIIKNTFDGLKVLGEGELTKKLTVKAAVFSASAKEKIEAVGGKTEVV